MKTISPETEYHGIETEEESSPGSPTQESNRLKPKELLLNQGENKFNSVSESRSYNESESLIICNSDLASSFQVVKTEKNKLNPGHYLHKVFLNGVAQKFKSQSLPSCLEKKKYQLNGGGGIVSENVRLCEESDEPVVRKSSCDQNGYAKVESKEASNNDSRFKTWPERGIDKVQNRKSEASCEINSSSCQTPLQKSDDNLNCSNVKNQNTKHTDKALHLNGDIKEENNEHHTLLNVSSSSSSSSKSVKNNCSKPVPLNEVLNKFPLAYSPVTRQLHIITESDKSKECNITGEEESDASFLTCLLDNNNLEDTSSVGDKTACRGWTIVDKSLDTSSDFTSTLQRVSTEVSSFSSTVSSLSDNSPSTNEDSALGSLLDHGDTCSLVSASGCSVLSEESNGAKPKKKSFSGFFSR